MKTLSSVKGFLQKVGESHDFSAKNIFYGLSHWIELTSPRLARQYLTYASELLEPHLLGRGVRVVTLNDVECRVLLPFRWQNKTIENQVSLGTVLSLAEFGLRVYLDRIFISFLQDMRVVSAKVELLQAAKRSETSERSETAKLLKESLFVVAHLSSMQQAQWRLSLQSHGKMVTNMTMNILNESGKCLGQVELVLCLSAPKALPPQ